MEFLPLRFESSGICWRSFSDWIFFLVFFFLSESFSGTSQNCAIIFFRRYWISISFKAKFIAFFGQGLKLQISNGWNLSTRAFRVQVVASETWLVKKAMNSTIKWIFLTLKLFLVEADIWISYTRVSNDICWLVDRSFDIFILMPWTEILSSWDDRRWKRNLISSTINAWIFSIKVIKDN